MLSVCEKVKNMLKRSNINYVKVAETLGTNNVAVGKLLYRGPMNFRHFVQFADIAGYDVVLVNEYGEEITFTMADVGNKW